MKTFSIFILTITGIIQWTHAAQASSRDVIVPAEHIYVPAGFDNNDNAQVIIAGYLPDLCYKNPKSTAEVTGKNISIKVSASLNLDMMICPQAIVPFIEVVSIGTLNPGDYNIIVNAQSRFAKASTIKISKAPTPAVDEHIYANVDYVEKIDGSRTVLLKGYNPSDCFVFDRVEFISNEKDTFSVLPIMKQTKTECQKTLTPFTIETSIPKGLGFHKLLLHVRVMNGRSVNTLFDNE